MLKKIVIAVSIVLIVVLAGAGVEAYRINADIDGLFHHKIPNQVCPTITPTVAGDSTATPTPTHPEKHHGHRHHHGRSHQGRSPRHHRHNQKNPLLRTTCRVATNITYPTLSGKQRINILVLGSDNDNKFVGATPNGKRTKSLLSQTMMVVSIDPVHHTVSMLSIPRDFWLYVPGYSTEGDSSTYHKIDEAMSLGSSDSSSNNLQARFDAGIALARQTVEDNFGIRIDYYAWVGLTGFVNVINTLHGIVIDAQHPILDDSYPNDLVQGHLVGSNNLYGETRVFIAPGPQYMDATTALEYVRSRHADLVGDFGRGARQMQMLLGIRRKADSLNFTDLGTITGLISDLHGTFQSDIGTTGTLLKMYGFAKKLKPNKIHRTILAPPKYSSIGNDNGEDTVDPNWAAITPVIKTMFKAPDKIKSGHKHHKKRKITPELAHQLITRVFGAIPAAELPKVSHPKIHGRIYFNVNGNIWAFNGKAPVQVTHSSNVTDPSVSRNGKKLVYAHRWRPTVSDIFLRNRKTHTRTQLTHDDTNDGYLRDEIWAYTPAISPDGQTVVYASDAYKVYNPSPYGTIDLALYKYDLATGTPTQMTYPLNGAGGDLDPAIDPANPNLVLFSRFFYRTDLSLACQIRVLDLTTGETTPATPVVNQAIEAAWQPNGKHVAFIENSGQGTKLVISRFKHDRLHIQSAKIADRGMVAEPTFSPDGRHLAYLKLVDNTFQMWEVNLHNGWPSGTPFRILSVPGITASSRLDWVK